MKLTRTTLKDRSRAVTEETHMPVPGCVARRRFDEITLNGEDLDQLLSLAERDSEAVVNWLGHMRSKMPPS